MICIAVVCAVGGGSLAAQIVYDLNDDWVAAMPTAGSAGVNPNGPWTYGHNTALTQAGFTANRAWDNWSPFDALAVWGNAVGTWPLMWHSYTATDPNPSGAEPGETVLQSGYNKPGFHSVVRWTAPIAGWFNINIDFQLGYGAEGTVILHNDTILSSAPIGNHVYNEDILLAAGDTIDFVMLGETGTSNASVLYETIMETVEPVIRCEDLGNYHPADLNHDCYFDMDDLLIMLHNWLGCNDPADPACTMVIS